MKMLKNFKFKFDRSSPVNNEAECLYMKVLIEKIVLSESHSLSTMVAIHLSNEATQQSQSTSSASTSSKKVTKQRAEELLDEWVASGYLLLLNDDAVVTLGPKAIAEFRDTLRTKFPDFITNCHLCNDIVMRPLMCPNEECEASLHKRCFNSYVSKQQKCPACKSNWEVAE